MAFTTTLMTEGREGDVTLGYQNKQLVVNETYNYQIRVAVSGGTTYLDVDRADILNTVGLPIPRLTTSPSGMGTCTGTTATRDTKNVSIWNVKATFSSSVEDNSQDSNPTTDPTTWVPLRETYLEPFETVLFKSTNNKPLVNGAAVPFANAPSVPKDNIRWDFAQFESVSVTDENIADRNNKLNNASYKGRAKHTLLLKIRSSVVGRYYGSLRRLTEYSLVWNPENWHRKFANVGNSFRVKEGADYKVYPYIYQKNKDVIHVGPLGSDNYLYDDDLDDAAGLPTGGTETADGTKYAKEPATPTLFYIERQVFEDTDFSAFLRI